MCTTQQLLKSHQNLNWNSNVSVSPLQNNITLHKKEIAVVQVQYYSMYNQKNTTLFEFQFLGQWPPFIQVAAPCAFQSSILALYSFMVQFRKKKVAAAVSIIWWHSLVPPPSLHPFWLPSCLVTCFDAFFSTTNNTKYSKIKIKYSNCVFYFRTTI